MGKNRQIKLCQKDCDVKLPVSGMTNQNANRICKRRCAGGMYKGPTYDDKRRPSAETAKLYGIGKLTNSRFNDKTINSMTINPQGTNPKSPSECLRLCTTPDGTVDKACYNACRTGAGTQGPTDPVADIDIGFAGTGPTDPVADIDIGSAKTGPSEPIGGLDIGGMVSGPTEPISDIDIGSALTGPSDPMGGIDIYGTADFGDPGGGLGKGKNRRRRKCEQCVQGCADQNLSYAADAACVAACEQTWDVTCTPSGTSGDPMTSGGAARKTGGRKGFIDQNIYRG